MLKKNKTSFPKSFSEIFNQLKEGNRRYVCGKSLRKLQDSRRRKAVVQEQNPWAIVISCSDSRVVPELIFNTGIGELFVIRIAGNVITTSVLASLEYALLVLNVTTIIILGHQNCGAIEAAWKKKKSSLPKKLTTSNLNAWLKKNVLISKKDDNCVSLQELVKENVFKGIDKLIKKSKVVQNALKGKRLKIWPAFYSLQTGQVFFLSKKK